jgi:hypothetical protein
VVKKLSVGLKTNSPYPNRKHNHGDILTKKRGYWVVKHTIPLTPKLGKTSYYIILQIAIILEE